MSERHGKVVVEYFRGNCACCIEPRKALFDLVNNKYKGKIEVIEKNFSENSDFASEALRRGIWNCSTFVVGNEKITDVLELDKKLEKTLEKTSRHC